jgi:N-acetylglucosamine kinase-like BadF-type ATPase
LDSQSTLIIALEGGGTRCQAALLDGYGQVLRLVESGPVNTNFVTFDEARASVLASLSGVLASSGVEGGQIGCLVSALVGPRFGAEVFGQLLPNAGYRYYGERDVVFARAGFYRPHGSAFVSATGATAWAVRADDGRQVSLGGWGALLGDEGSAYSAGLLGLRASAKALEGRLDEPTRLVEAIAGHLGIRVETYHIDLVQLAYQKPLSRAEIASVAPVVTRLAREGDLIATRITNKVTMDLTSLALHAARRLFAGNESFDVAAAGGFLNAGELVLSPLRQAFKEEFPRATLVYGKEEPAVALGKLALYDIIHQK